MARTPSPTHAMIHMLSSESPRSAGTSRPRPSAIGHVIRSYADVGGRGGRCLRTPAIDSDDGTCTPPRAARPVGDPRVDELAGVVGHLVGSTAELGRRGEEHDAESRPPVGRQAEAGAVHAQDALGTQQAEHEVLVGPPLRQRHLRHRIERGLAAPRRHPGHGVEARRGQLGALAQRLPERRLMRAVAGERRRHRVCIGPGLHSRPSASFLMAASASSRRGVDPPPSSRPASPAPDRPWTGRERDDRRLRQPSPRAAALTRRSRDRRRPRRRESPGRAAPRSPRAGAATGSGRPRRSGCSGSMNTRSAGLRRDRAAPCARDRGASRAPGPSGSRADRRRASASTAV